MATRYLGLGTVIAVDSDANATYETISLIIEGTPPAREREEVDDTTLDATLQTNSPGIEKHSQFSFRMKLDGADTNQGAVYTLFGSKAKVNWKITWTDTKVWVFEGWVQKYEPQAIQHNKHNEVMVTVDRTSAITIS